MTVKEQVVQTIETLNETELEQVAEYLAFLKFRSSSSALTPLDGIQVMALYAEFADEDRALAEEGMDEYSTHLLAEDAG